jgi:polyisoprenyl-phosphate glycosyltransferase
MIASHRQVKREPQVRTELPVVIPCYNEEAVIHELHRRVTLVCCSLVGESYELILVNDGSFDNTWPMLNALVHDDHRIVAVDLYRNHGHQLALTAGLLPEIMRLMDEGADVVYGQRIQRERRDLV